MTPGDVVNRFFNGIPGKSKYLESKALNDKATALIRTDNQTVAYRVFIKNTVIIIFSQYPQLDYTHGTFISGKISQLFSQITNNNQALKKISSLTNDITVSELINLICRYYGEEGNVTFIKEVRNYLRMHELITYECGHKDSSELADIHEKTEVFKKDENGNYILDKSGLPVIERKMVCTSCMKAAQIPDLRAQGHRTGYIKPIQSTTFNKWPFTTNLGLELELIKVLPVDPSITQRYKMRVMQDQSIKLSGHNMANAKVKVPIPTSKYAYGIEVCTEPANGDVYYNNITGMMKELTPAVVVNKTCALHVHADWSHLSDAQKIPASLFLKAMDRLLFAIQPMSRLENTFSRPCDLYRLAADIDTLHKQTAWKVGNKYDGISFVHAAPPNMPGVEDKQSYGTVEFRMSSGTRNIKKILMWTQLVCRLMEIAETITAPELQRIRLAVLKTFNDGDISDLVNCFFSLAKLKDQELNRSPEFLDDLKAWYIERFKKFEIFSNSIDIKDDIVFTKTEVTIPNLSEAKLFHVEDFISTYEQLEELEGVG
jgi:hypothetical protein